MFIKLNKKAQQTAEYAILIALVVGAVIAMQTYAQRTIQARVRGAAMYLASQGSGALGDDLQYEPYYLDSAYTVTRNEETIEQQLGGPNATITKNQDNWRSRTGSQTTTWNINNEGNW